MERTNGKQAKSERNVPPAIGPSVIEPTGGESGAKPREMALGRRNPCAIKWRLISNSQRKNQARRLVLREKILFVVSAFAQTH
jgi:hypothetical protein